MFLDLILRNTVNLLHLFIHKVSQLQGDRAVITYEGTVVAAVHISDLTLV